MPHNKDCPTGKIRNPNTGSCIDANGKLACALIAKFIALKPQSILTFVKKI